MSEVTNKQMMETNREEQPAPAKENTCRVTDFERMTTWNTVRDIFKALQVFVMFFEDDRTVVLDLQDSVTAPIIRSYNYCRTILHKNMLDIPDNVYDDLDELIAELRYWIYGLPEEAYNEDGFKLDYFDKLLYLDSKDKYSKDKYSKDKYLKDKYSKDKYSRNKSEAEYSEQARRVTSWVVRDYYRAVRRILKNYIPRELD